MFQTTQWIREKIVPKAVKMTLERATSGRDEKEVMFLLKIHLLDHLPNPEPHFKKLGFRAGIWKWRHPNKAAIEVHVSRDTGGYSEEPYIKIVETVPKPDADRALDEIVHQFRRAGYSADLRTKGLQGHEKWLSSGRRKTDKGNGFQDSPRKITCGFPLKCGSPVTSSWPCSKAVA